MTSWITPFVNFDAECFKEGIANGYFVKDMRGVASLVKWWQGTGGLVDFTNKDAVAWYFRRLNELK